MAQLHASARWIALLASLVGLTAAGCHDDSPDSHNAAFVGQALQADGSAPDAIWVFSRRDGASAETTTITKVNVDGTFRVRTSPAGDFLVVLNDGHGHGVVSGATTRAGETTDMGTLTVTDLEDFPNIVDLSGVGFEERLTYGAQGLSVFGTSDDTSAAYAMQSTTVADRWDLVSVNTATGGVEILREGEALYPSDDPLINVASDRWLTFGRRLDAEEPLAHWAAHNLATGAVFEGRTNLVGELWPQWVVMPDAGMVVVETAHASTGDSLVSANLTVVDPRGEIAHELDVPVDGVADLTLLDVSAGRATLLSHAACPAAPCPDSTLLAASLTGSDSRAIGVLPATSWATSRVQDHRFYVVFDNPWERDAVAIEEVELATAARRVIAQLPTVGRGGLNFVLSPDGDRLAVWMVGLADGPDRAWELDLATGTIFDVPDQRQVDGRAVRFCEAGAYCQLDYGAGGQLRMIVSLPGADAPEDDALAIIDFEPDHSESGILLEFPFADQVQLVESGRSLRRLVLATSAEPPVLQVFEIQDGEPPRQRTFLSGFHQAPTFDPSGEAITYAADDPLSGSAQLFRLELAGLPF